METTYVKCGECGAENVSMIQITPEALVTSTLKGNTQPCANCGARILVENDTVYFKEAN